MADTIIYPDMQRDPDVQRCQYIASAGSSSYNSLMKKFQYIDTYMD
jgi:hypothetical protein